MSNYVKITEYASKDGLVSGNPAKVIRGTELNDEFNAIQTAVGTKADLNSPVFIGNPTAPTATLGDNTNKLATTAFVFNNSIPSGGIIIWSGSQASIPTGWLLCNGASGTPDLRDRFIVGAGNQYAVGNTGGSKDAIVVDHSHTTQDSGSFLSGSAGVNIQAASGVFGSSSGMIGLAGAVANKTAATASFSGTYYTTIFLQGGNHTHNVNSTGGSGVNANLPPYYALCYIMKA